MMVRTVRDWTVWCAIDRTHAHAVTMADGWDKVHDVLVVILHYDPPYRTIFTGHEYYGYIGDGTRSDQWRTWNVDPMCGNCHVAPGREVDQAFFHQVLDCAMTRHFFATTLSAYTVTTDVAGTDDG